MNDSEIRALQDFMLHTQSYLEWKEARSWTNDYYEQKWQEARSWMNDYYEDLASKYEITVDYLMAEFILN